MKTKIVIILIAMLGVTSISFAQKRSKELAPDKLAYAQLLDKAILNKSFEFVAEKMQTNIPSKPYTYFYDDDYTISVMGSVIKTHTNRINTSLFAPFELNTEALKYEVKGTTTEKKGAIITLQARNADNRLCYLTFTVFSDGSTNLLYGGFDRVLFYGKLQILDPASY